MIDQRQNQACKQQDQDMSSKIATEKGTSTFPRTRRKERRAQNMKNFRRKNLFCRSSATSSRRVGVTLSEYYLLPWKIRIRPKYD